MRAVLGALIASTAIAGVAHAQINPDDYPPLAQRLNHEGRVAYRLQYGRDGRATNCTVIASSGYVELDDATCSIMVRRARFAPGKSGTHDDAVTWRMPSNH